MPISPSPRFRLTPRDKEVLRLLRQGLPNKDIGEALGISPRTVKQHLARMFVRAGIERGQKRVQLALMEIE